MKRRFDAILDHCLARMRAGESVEQCLERHPEWAGELRPLLEMAAHLHAVPAPTLGPEARAEGEQKLMAAFAAAQRPARKPSPVVGWHARVPQVRWQWAVALAFVLFLAAGGGAVAASGRSLPGDLLYPVKLAAQDTRLALTSNVGRHQALEAEYGEYRRQDVRAVLQDGRSASVEFEGTLEAMEGEVWRVGGLPARIRESTTISGRPRPGAPVRVSGFLPGDGELLVTELQVEPDEFEPTPRATETEESTRNVEPTHPPAPIPSETRPPEEPSDPGDKPTATATPQPTHGVEPTHAPHPTEAREPTRTPKPTKTHEPTEEPEPTEGHEPTQTPEPSHTPVPTQTPEPTP